MRLPHISAVVLLGLFAEGCEHAGSPLSPTPEKRLQGTYTLTAATSPSCEFQGSWLFRADITQSGRDLKVKLWKSNGDSLCSSAGTYEPCRDFFFGQDNPDGVLFFPEGMDALFMSKDPDVWFVLRYGERGTGHAFGQYVDGRIEARYDGAVIDQKKGRSCDAANHPLTFVRRW